MTFRGEDEMLMTIPRGRGRPRKEQKPLTPAQEEIGQIRQRLGLTQEAFAEAIGVIPNTVSRWERGERDVSRSVLKLARRLLAQH
jgi:DNA-binding transcriptional regulator YiaG